MRKKLTAAFVKKATAGAKGDRIVYWDESLPGFGLVVTVGSHRSFIAQYRAHGQSRRYTIGSAAVLDLEQARKQAKSILGQVAQGADPVMDKRRAAESDRHSLRAVCERYLHREGPKIRTADKRRAMLERLVYPKFAARPIDDVSRLDIVHLLDDVEDKHGPAMADHVLAILRRVMNWHATRSSEYRSPIVPGMSRRDPESRERSRVLTDDELRAVWKTAESYAGPWGHLVRFLLLTAARRSEAAEMTWAELSEGMWAIPAARYKTKNEVVLPLSAPARKVLSEIPRTQGCEFCFSTDGRRPISGFSTFKLRFDIECGVKDWRLHDLRRTARSLLSRAGVNPDIAERCLGHVIGGVRGVYDRHQYLEEMRHAFERLASLIDTIVRQEPNVVPMERKIPG